MKKTLFTLIILLICFILIQSTIPERISAIESQWVTESVLNPLFGFFGIGTDKDIIRKIAHAVEFCVLAVVISILWKRPLQSFYAGFTLAFFDESLQVVTGRGAKVTDVWIDLIGVAIGILIGTLVRKMGKMKIQKKETRANLYADHH